MNHHELDRLLGVWAGRDPNRPTAGQLNAAHEAVTGIDELLGELGRTRQQLVTELVRAHRAADARVDALSDDA